MRSFPSNKKQNTRKRMGVIAFIALGANLPSPLGAQHHTLRGVRKNLMAAGAIVLSASRLYRTEAIGAGMTGTFINGVMMCRLPCVPDRFLRRMQKIEHLYGRDPATRARALDLDMLDARPAWRSSEECRLPHPRMCARRFVLAPLAELAPHHRIDRRSVKQWLARARDAVFPLR